MPDWLRPYFPEGWTGWHLFALSVVLFVVMLVGSLIVSGWIIIKLPPDHFADSKPRRLWVDKHPIVRFVLVALKNLLGLALVALGVVLSLPGVPGQGILTILIGLMLLDFPGRRRFERWLISRRGVLKAINRLRARYGKPPMYLHQVPTDPPGTVGPG